eukprot:gene17844-19625_t
MADVRDILEIENQQQTAASKDTILHNKKKMRKPTDSSFRRPEGMHRELYALLYSDQRDPSSLTPSDTTQGYKQVKAKIGRSKVRPWLWSPFTNPSRDDGLVLNHWIRKNDSGKKYPYSKFNKDVEIPQYTDEEYKLYLTENDNNWSKEETDHLFDLCRRFDLRFFIIHDRYDKEQFKDRSVEEIKDRYFQIIGKLTLIKTVPGQQPENQPPVFDAEHETRRKRQLLKLYNRTPEQIEEEEMLVAELKKIELRKKEREKKQQELSKLIIAAEKKPSITDHNLMPMSKKEKKQGKKKQKKRLENHSNDPKPKQEQSGIRFPEAKGAGVSLRSAKLKMPQSVGTKKSKAVEQLLDELGVELYPMPSEGIVQDFNELRNDLLLLYELKHALGNCEFELQTLRHRFEGLAPNRDISSIIGFSLDFPNQSESQEGTSSSLLIDVVAAGNLRKRRTATTLLETTPWKKSRKAGCRCGRAINSNIRRFARMPPKKKEEPKDVPLLGRFGTSLKCGIVGIPNVGKSTFFNVLTKSQASAENFPFCTIDPNENNRVPVPDERYDFLCKHHKPASKVPAFLNVVDIAGLVKGASEGQGLGNAFLSHIKACDSIFHMLRAFDDEDVTHVDGDINPVRDIETIMEELRLKDVEYLAARINDLEKKVVRGGDKKGLLEFDFMKRLYTLVSEDKKHIRFSTHWTAVEIELLNKHLLLTAKPMIYLINLSEKDFIRKKNKWLVKIKDWIDKNDPGASIIPFSGSFELKVLEMEPEEAKQYQEEHKAQTILPKIIKTGFQTLQLQYFFTAGKDEVKAWTIQKGTKAPQAAGKIHTDFEKGFIMAEVMKYDDFHELGSESAVKAKGKYCQQGKNYVVQDGDIIFFKFNAGAGLTSVKKNVMCAVYTRSSLFGGEERFEIKGGDIYGNGRD